jgi:hypothetical protein
MPLAATQFLIFVSIFMLSYPRGYDMISNKTYSYPYSTHKRYPFSVCRKPLLSDEKACDVQASPRRVAASALERVSFERLEQA